MKKILVTRKLLKECEEKALKMFEELFLVQIASYDEAIKFVNEEMTEMISTLRIFETYQKIIQSNDMMNDQSVNTIGRVG